MIVPDSKRFQAEVFAVVETLFSMRSQQARIRNVKRVLRSTFERAPNVQEGLFQILIAEILQTFLEIGHTGFAKRQRSKIVDRFSSNFVDPLVNTV